MGTQTLVGTTKPALRVTGGGDQITISGKALGRYAFCRATNRVEDDPFMNTEEMNATVSFAFDHSKMPWFDPKGPFTEKNRWVFAHTASVGTTKGELPESILNRLAQVVNLQPGYQSKVILHLDGSATLQVNRK